MSLLLMGEKKRELKKKIPFCIWILGTTDRIQTHWRNINLQFWSESSIRILSFWTHSWKHMEPKQLTVPGKHTPGGMLTKHGKQPTSL